MFAESVAVRRFYFGQPTTPTITIECMMGVILLSEFFVVCTSFPAPHNPAQHFRYSIDTTTGLWQHHPTEHLPRKGQRNLALDQSRDLV